MLTHKETIKELVETLESLSDSDLQFISRIARVLGKQDSSEGADAFDDWAIAIAKKKKASKYLTLRKKVLSLNYGKRKRKG